MVMTGEDVGTCLDDRMHDNKYFTPSGKISAGCGGFGGEAPDLVRHCGIDFIFLEPPAQSADIVLSLFSFFFSLLSPPPCVSSSSLPPFPHPAHPPNPLSPQAPSLSLYLSLPLSVSLKSELQLVQVQVRCCCCWHKQM